MDKERKGRAEGGGGTVTLFLHHRESKRAIQSRRWSHCPFTQDSQITSTQSSLCVLNCPNTQHGQNSKETVTLFLHHNSKDSKEMVTLSLYPGQSEQ